MRRGANIRLKYIVIPLPLSLAYVGNENLYCDKLQFNNKDAFFSVFSLILEKCELT